MIFSSSPTKRRLFQKGPCRAMIFHVLSGKMVFFFPKTQYFFLGQEASDDLSQEIHGNMIYKPVLVPRPPAKKNQGWSFPGKNTPKVD